MTTIADSHFTAPDGNRYFRRNAPSVGVGKWGEKKVPLTQANYLAVVGSVKASLLDGKLNKGAPVSIAWERESTAAVEASAKLYFVAGGTATFSHQRAKEADLELVRFHIDQGPLMRVLNNDADAVRAAMKKEGNDARVCSSAWVVMSAELAKRFTTAASLEVSGTTANGLSITATGNGTWQGSEKITLGAGTVFAYGLHKVTKWDGDRIEDMDDDWQSFN